MFTYRKLRYDPEIDRRGGQTQNRTETSKRLSSLSPTLLPSLCLLLFFFSFIFQHFPVNMYSFIIKIYLAAITSVENLENAVTLLRGH
jgi:hypothetical protein